MSKETRTYQITGDVRVLNQLEDMLSVVQYLGEIGASRYLKFGIDGDGQAKIKVEKNGEKIQCSRPVEINNEVIFGGLC
jgi:hypothetical protein